MNPDTLLVATGVDTLLVAADTMLIAKPHFLTSNIFIADLLRQIAVSLAVAIIGTVVTVTFFMMRGDRLKSRRLTPPWVNWLFVFGYIGMLGEIIYGRMIMLGNPMTWLTILSVGGLLLNLIAIAAAGYYGVEWRYRRPDPEKEPR